MSAILKQRKLFLTKVFELNDKSLKIKVSTPISYVEDEIDFENISRKYTRKKLPNTIILVITSLLLIATIIAICSHYLEKDGSSLSDIAFYFVLLVIFVSLLYATYENQISVMLYTGKLLIFYANSPSKKETDDFIELVKKEQKSYLLSRYAQHSEYLSEEQMSNNLKWLWERKVIDDKELKQLRENLLQKTNGSQAVGFRFNTDNN